MEWRTRHIALLTMLAMIAEAATAEVLPNPGPRDARVRTATYDPDEIYLLRAFVGYQIEIEFEAGERILGQGGGDLEGVAIGADGSRLYLKPKAEDVTTNLTVATDRRRYRFDYRVARGRPDPLRDEVMYLVRFKYPPTQPAAGPTAAERIEKEFAQAGHQRPRNVDYWYCGSESLQPLAASDDGVHTRLTFGAKSEVPAIFVRNDDETESLLNFSMDEGDIVIHRVARRLIVRRGRLAGCIVNQAYQGGGQRLESGTISPQVQRDRVERRP